MAESASPCASGGEGRRKARASTVLRPLVSARCGRDSSGLPLGECRRTHKPSRCPAEGAATHVAGPHAAQPGPAADAARPQRAVVATATPLTRAQLLAHPSWTHHAQPPLPLSINDTHSRSHHGADLARQRNRRKLPSVDAVLVQVPDVQLHAGVVLRLDELVGPRAAGVAGARHLSCCLAAPAGASPKTRARAARRGAGAHTHTRTHHLRGM